MKSALIQAIQLILSGNAELVNILKVTARMSLTSSLCALLIGVFHTNVYATVIPLLFPRVGLMFRPMIDKKRGGTASDTEGSDLID